METDFLDLLTRQDLVNRDREGAAEVAAIAGWPLGTQEATGEEEGDGSA
jgi:hypothetical protein